MANYLALIRKADFIDLFKYGSLHINIDMIKEFSCTVEELPNCEQIFQDLLNFANAFDNTFEYLFIHYEYLQGRKNDVNIADVKGIYPLDNEAKKELTLSLDQRIVIHNPLWSNAVYVIQKNQFIKNCKNGTSNIWKIFNISDSIENANDIITDEVIKEVVDELYDNKRPSGDVPIWVYIMRYERHAFYPNNNIGAIMDAVNAIFNHLKKQEVDSSEIESTNIMQFLQKLNNHPDISIDNAFQRLYEENTLFNFVNYSKSIVSDIDLLKTATLFYIYRNRYKDGLRYESNLIESDKKYGKEFVVACYMLGCFLGHDHTYDCLYEYLPLTIFTHNIDKNNPASNINQGETVNEPHLNDNDNIKETSSDLQRIDIKFPIKMIKLKKDGTPNKNTKPKEIYNKEDYTEHKQKGWIQQEENKNSELPFDQ